MASSKMNSRRIGINLLALLPRVSGGIEFYVRNLLTALGRLDTTNQYYLFTSHDNHGTFDLGYSNFQRVQVGAHARPQISRIAWEQFYLPWQVKRLKIDVLHSPTYTWPVFAPVPGVVSICDMLYKIYPESLQRSKLLFWSWFIPWSVKRCRRVLTISENSKQDIVRYLGVNPEKVIVTPLALDSSLPHATYISEADIQRIRSSYDLSGPYLLDVGGVGAHKNAVALVRALALFRQSHHGDPLSLVITGHDYGAEQQIRQVTHELGLDACVRLPGYVPRQDLPALYSGASAYVSPSYFEGFGLTLLEAMAYGTPVITSDRSSLPEVAGDAALIVDPDSPTQLANALGLLMADITMRTNLIAKGHRRVEAYSWENTAHATLKAYSEAMDG
jgi:glycosyltransferase involved in cell wall biosynthesis